jgi:hypothetical protein
VHTTGFDPTQTSFWQVSVCVQALESLQGVPFGAPEHVTTQAPGPAAVLTKPETVPLNCDEVVVPVVLTTTTKFDCAATWNE